MSSLHLCLDTLILTSAEVRVKLTMPEQGQLIIINLLFTASSPMPANFNIPDVVPLALCATVSNE